MLKDQRRPIFRFLIVPAICSVAGLQTRMVLFNNFGVEIAGLNGEEVGAVRSVREIPGFLALLAVYILLVLREHTIAVPLHYPDFQTEN